MANPQTEHGYTRVANELLEAVLLADLGKREQKVVWAVIRMTYGCERESVTLSTGEVARIAQVSRSNVSRCLRSLSAARVLTVEPSGVVRHGVEIPRIQINENHSEWHTPTRTVRGNYQPWAEKRIRVFSRDGHACVYCGDRNGPFECDHVVPQSRGGGDGEGNLVTACVRCNRAKGDSLLGEWIGVGVLQAGEEK